MNEPKEHQEQRKRRPRRSTRHRRIRYVSILPLLMTLFNGVFGFAAILFASQGHFAKAGYFIAFAMIADMLDGRLARMSQTTSSFGGQLDSLCDVVSFGLAPAFITVTLLDETLIASLELSPFLVKYITRFIWLSGAAYLCCTVIRLARFNVENEEDESAHMSFLGLPSPAAAGVIISLVIFHQEILPEIATEQATLSSIFGTTILILLPIATYGTAALMVSRIRYSHILNQYLRGRKPFTQFILVLILIGAVIWCRQAGMVVGFCGFALNGFIRWLLQVIRKKKILESLHLTESESTKLDPQTEN